MAGGRVLAPGFIDVHTHDDINVIRMPEYLPKLSRGGDDGDRRQLRDQCGDRHHAGEVPDPMNLLGEQQHFIYPTVEAYAHAVEAARPSLNVGTLIGHTALRNNHMDDLFRPANETEIAGMRVQLRDALRRGSIRAQYRAGLRQRLPVDHRGGDGAGGRAGGREGRLYHPFTFRV